LILLLLSLLDRPNAPLLPEVRVVTPGTGGRPDDLESTGVELLKDCFLVKPSASSLVILLTAAVFWIELLLLLADITLSLVEIVG
jgi:hypothetical protein